MTTPKEFKDKRSVSHLATWSLSTSKPGFGVEQLRDNNFDTYWQSDGPQPHFINIEFNRRMRLSHLAIHSDYRQDESYAPSKICIKIGTCTYDLEEFVTLELEEVTGWIHIPLCIADK